MTRNLKDLGSLFCFALIAFIAIGVLNIHVTFKNVFLVFFVTVVALTAVRMMIGFVAKRIETAKRNARRNVREMRRNRVEG